LEVRTVPVPGDDFTRPGDRFYRSNATWLRTDPQLQIVRPVVVAPAVSMMHSFIGEEMPAKSLLHHEDVLEDVVARPRARGPLPRVPDMRCTCWI
jgi:hypothetical protein